MAIIQELRIPSMMRLAYVISLESKCKDKKVGCVLLDYEGKIISHGYNNTNKCSQECDHGEKCPALHAEIMALLNTRIPHPYYLVSTLEPCAECAKALYFAGVQYVYYMSPTNPLKSGRRFWNEFTNGVWQRLGELDFSGDNRADSTLSLGNGEATAERQRPDA